MARQSQPLKEREIVHCLKTLRAFAKEKERYKEHPRFSVVAHAAQQLIETLSQQAQEADPPEEAQAPEEDHTTADFGIRLATRKRCYNCQTRMLERHPHYESMCVPCGQINWEKRHQSADLSGRCAVVTGGRSKIGYATVLKLLRAGARVFATTRFPKTASERFAKEADFANWKDRLLIHGLDLRSFPAIEAFAEELKRHTEVVDILINNAAQTIRRPPQYYQPVIKNELSPFASPTSRALLSPTTLQQHQLSQLPQLDQAPEEAQAGQQTALTPFSDWPGLFLPAQAPTQAKAHSAFLSSVPFARADLLVDPADFPKEQLNLYGEPVDNRARTSWEESIEEVDPFELLEVHVINSMAPFMLMKHLRPMMLRSRHPQRFIINVTSIEGQFVTSKKPTKGPKHPHTNMTKAALNMLTFSGAHADSKLGLYRNAVDPGWASIENALPIREQWFALGVKTPIDFEDAAARICDPIFSTLLSGESVHGKLFKNYEIVPW